MLTRTNIIIATVTTLGFLCCLGGCENPASGNSDERTLSGTIAGWSLGTGYSVMVAMGTDGAFLTDGPYPISETGAFSVPYPEALEPENTRDMSWALDKGLTVSAEDARMGMLFLSVNDPADNEAGRLVMSKGESDFCRLYYFSKATTIRGTYTSEDYSDIVDIVVPAAGWTTLFLSSEVSGETTATTWKTGLSAEGYSWILYGD